MKFSLRRPLTLMLWVSAAACTDPLVLQLPSDAAQSANGGAMADDASGYAGAGNHDAATTQDSSMPATGGVGGGSAGSGAGGIGGVPSDGGPSSGGKGQDASVDLPKESCTTCRGPTSIGLLGVQVGADATCPSGYEGGEVLLHTGVTTTDQCAGCGCLPSPIKCSVSVFSYTKDEATDVANSYHTACAEDFSLNGGHLEFTLADDSDAAKCADIIGTNVYPRIGPLVANGGDKCDVTGAPTKPTVSWSNSTKFCTTTTTTQDSCGSGQACLHATVARACLLMEGTDATCPTGYSPVGQTWYTGFDDPRVCDSCACSVTKVGDCGTRTVFVDAPPGGGGKCGASATAMTEPTNTPLCGGLLDYPWFSLNGSSVPAQCAAASKAQGALAPTGAKTLCCM